MTVVLSQSHLGRALRKISYKYLSFNEEYLSGTEYLKRKTILYVIFFLLNSTIGFSAQYTEIIVGLLSVTISDVVLGLKRARSIGMNNRGSTLLILLVVVASLFLHLIYDAYNTQSMSELYALSVLNPQIVPPPTSLMLTTTGMEIFLWGVLAQFVFGNTNSMFSSDIKARIRPLSLFSLERQLKLAVLLEQENDQRTRAGLREDHFVFPWTITMVMTNLEGWGTKKSILQKPTIVKTISKFSNNDSFCLCCFCAGKVTPLALLTDDQIGKVSKMKLRNGEFKEVNYNRELKTYLEQNPIL